MCCHVGPEPETLDCGSRKSSVETSQSKDTKLDALPNGHAVIGSGERIPDRAICENTPYISWASIITITLIVAHATSPKGDSLVAATKVATSDSTSQHTVVATTNSTSEDTDDNTPLPVGGHEDNPSDSGTTSDDEDEPSSTTEVSSYYGNFICR